MAALAVAIGFFAAGASTSNLMLLAGGLAVFLISGAGIVLNDFFDVEMDKVNEPKRPIPSGKISPKQALVFSSLLFVAGLALSYYVNIYCFALALLNTFLEIGYAAKLKQISLIGNLTDSWFVASSFLYGALITADSALSISTPASALLVPLIAITAFTANASREIFGDIQDLEGDKKAGAKTLPVIAGTHVSKKAAVFLLAIAIILGFVPFQLGFFGIEYLAVVIIADLLFAYSINLEPEKNQKMMRTAMAVAILAFAVGVIF